MYHTPSLAIEQDALTNGSSKIIVELSATATPSVAEGQGETGHGDLVEIDKLVGYEIHGNNNLTFLFRWKGMKEWDALWKKPEADLQSEAPAVVARYWDAYNMGKGWKGHGWRPSDRLPPYSPDDVMRGRHHPARIRNHKTDGRGQYHIQIECLRWPVKRYWT